MAEVFLVYLLNINESGLPLDYNILKNYLLAHRSADLWVPFHMTTQLKRSQDMRRICLLTTRLLESPSAILKWSLFYR